jgi:hypothetical protein
MYADDDLLIDEELLIVELLKVEFPEASFTTTPSSLTSKEVPFVVVQSMELDDGLDAIGQRWLIEITSSHKTREGAKNLASGIYAAMGKFHRETAGSDVLGRIGSVTRYKPERYSTSTSVGREHLYHYHARYDIEVVH